MIAETQRVCLESDTLQNTAWHKEAHPPVASIPPRPRCRRRQGYRSPWIHAFAGMTEEERMTAGAK